MATEKLDYQKLMADLSAEFGINDLAPDKREELLGNISEALMKRLYFETLEKLSDKSVDDYEKLIEKNATPEEMAAFLEAEIPEYQTFVQGIIDRFKVEMKQVLSA